MEKQKKMLHETPLLSVITEVEVVPDIILNVNQISMHNTRFQNTAEKQGGC
ncbi:MAG: hypothetical protein OEY38_21865 [Gammaproteobacteria bacterium]|nr:hypothetical protein [Gammaproteobacteria bacterium]